MQFGLQKYLQAKYPGSSVFSDNYLKGGLKLVFLVVVVVVVVAPALLLFKASNAYLLIGMKFSFWINDLIAGMHTKILELP